MTDTDKIKKMLSLIVAILLLQVIFSIILLYNIISLSSASYVNDYMSPHTSKIISEIMSQSTHVLGKKESPITIIMFADFQCPYCNATFPVINHVIDNYKDKVKFSFHHFPLPEHKEAWKIALSFEAAGNQNKFWEMYKLFVDQYQKQGDKALSYEAIINNAKALNLSIEDFKSDIDHKTNLKVIQKDIESGQRLGITGIPTVYINDKQINGIQEYQTYSQVIEEELARNNNY